MRTLSAASLLALMLLASPSRSEDETPPAGFKPIFTGKNLDGWKIHAGKLDVWGAEGGVLFCDKGGGGWLMSEKEYGDFEVMFEYKLPKNGNSGLGLRAPMKGDPAYEGMEIQLIDDQNWKGLEVWQHTGSIYNVVPAAKQNNKPIGEWNRMKATCKGKQVKIELNGETLVDADLSKYEAEHAKKHPGILRDKGHIGFQSYNFRVEFRKIWVKEL